MTASGNTAAETEGGKLNLRTDVADGASGIETHRSGYE
jgi:hypothetical protein